jgi:PTS system nitrogen regulatory IIA component
MANLVMSGQLLQNGIIYAFAMEKSFYNISQTAQLLGVSEKTVYRMVTARKLPFAVKIGGQWRFHRDQLTTWVNGNKNHAPNSSSIYTDISVLESLENGGIFYHIHGRDRDEILDEIFSNLPYSTSLDITELKISILTREALVSSSHAGVAFLTTSSTRPCFYERTISVLCFLEQEIDIHALDRRPTRAAFITIPANNTERRIVCEKLRRLSMEPDFMEKLDPACTRRELFAFLRAKEKTLF